MDRQVASRLLSKTLAYHECGKPELANKYAGALVHYLAQEGIHAETALRDVARMAASSIKVDETALMDAARTALKSPPAISGNLVHLL